MVNRSASQTDRVFRALADSTRREILLRVAQQDHTVAELSEPFAISAPAVSRHLKILEDAGILERVRTGKHHRFHLNPRPLAEVHATLNALTAFWLERLNELEAFLDHEKSNAKPKQK
jgi:DNA-binding transcriptional ArsR family regulator